MNLSASMVQALLSCPASSEWLLQLLLLHLACHSVTNSLCIVWVCADVALMLNQTSITQSSSYHARHLIQNQHAGLLQ